MGFVGWGFCLQWELGLRGGLRGREEGRDVWAGNVVGLYWYWGGEGREEEGVFDVDG